MRVAHLRRELFHRRWASAALAVALVAAQGASLAHLSLVRHEICPEHGELIHPDAAPHAVATQPGDPRRPSAFGVEERAAAFGDDHCTVVGHRRESALPSSSDVIVPGEVAPATVCLELAWAPAASEPRFRVAPKQSPPA
jgi:hypothetical protein